MNHVKLSPELQKARINEQDFKEKRKAFEKAGEPSEDAEVYLGLYEDLIEECNDYQELEKLFKALAHIQEQFGKESFEYPQKSLQAKLLGSEEQGATKVRISSNECCDSCREFEGNVMQLQDALMSLPIPSDQYSASINSEPSASSATYEISEDTATVSKNPPSGGEIIPDPP